MKAYLNLHGYPKETPSIKLMKEVPITTEWRRRMALRLVRGQMQYVHPKLKLAAEAAVTELANRRLGINWKKAYADFRAFIVGDFDTFRVKYKRLYWTAKERWGKKKVDTGGL